MVAEYTELIRAMNHEHRYVFLREETEPSRQWGDRILERHVLDVFFCEGCLAYQRKHVLIYSH